MIFIFDDVFATVKNRVGLLGKHLRGCRTSKKILIFCLVSVICVLIGMGAVGTRFGYKVSYGGKVIASIGSKKQFTAAVSLISDLMKGNSSQETVEKLSYNPSLVLASQLKSEGQLAKAILESNQKVVAAAALTVDGESVAVYRYTELKAMLDQRLAQFETAGVKCSSAFLQDVQVEQGYYLVFELNDEQTVRETVDSLSVETVLVTETDAAIPFQTIQQSDPTRSIGSSAVIAAGQEGVLRTTTQIKWINGVEVERVTLHSETVSNPVDQVVAVGTAKSTASAEEKNAAYASGFIFPLGNAKYRIGAYFGDGRNHRGIDICADAGTKIYAVAAGKVVQSGYDGSYGNCVVIDHGNGYQTRYAHNTLNVVKVGDTVSAGDVIGTVGRTGNATGNHVHFEVIKGNTRVDPAPYIGLS
ncbi:MAG: peptidoglycan DD-metalloendopeptidase family protein [Clostridia bacterium]|nr:peptidoglycan DD-metalloendopeptidase family protein [Clostridia bacterium]